MTKNKITLALAITAAIGISNQASAAGFQLAEYSATGLGRAFAGEAAMADNASAQFRNPVLRLVLTLACAPILVPISKHQCLVTKQKCIRLKSTLTLVTKLMIS